MLSQATVQQLINFFVRILIDRNAKCIDFISDCLKYYYFEVGCISRGVRWAVRLVSSRFSSFNDWFKGIIILVLVNENE